MLTIRSPETHYEDLPCDYQVAHFMQANLCSPRHRLHHMYTHIASPLYTKYDAPSRVLSSHCLVYFNEAVHYSLLLAPKFVVLLYFMMFLELT